MFERYTEHARRIIFFARSEASDYGSDYIEPEHMLLALTRDGSSAARTLLTPDQALSLERRIRESLVANQVTPKHVDMPLSRSAKRALEEAAKAADGLNSREIDTGHIVLGILSHAPPSTVQILEEHGVTREAVRHALRRTGNSAPPRSRDALHLLVDRLPEAALDQAYTVLSYMCERF